MATKRPTWTEHTPTPEEVLAVRKAAGMTQEEAGAVLFCSRRGWQEWEKGRRDMHPAFWDLFNDRVRLLK